MISQSQSMAGNQLNYEIPQGHYNFQRECLEFHNIVRREHRCPELTWSTELAGEAQGWAEKLADRGYISYAEGEFGENIDVIPIAGPDEVVTGKQICDKWKNERAKYKFESPGWQPGTNHFTQMIWKSSSEFGIGRATSYIRRAVIVVAFYNPAGNVNWPGEFQANVPRLLSKCDFDD